jgi:gliding motility-associated-like protein
MAPVIQICPGDSVLIWVKPSGGHPLPNLLYFYSWKQNNSKDSSFWVNPMVSTTYEVSVSDSCQTFTVKGKTAITVVKPIADFSISSHTLFEDLPITFQNLTQNGNNYNWSFGDGNSSTMVHPNNTFLDPGTYTVNLIATDEKGCMDSIKKPITIEEEYYVYIPNTFTPDGGRINEAFKVSTIGISSFEIIICNRWGEIVFSSQDQYFRWDGTYNNFQSKEGVYTYKVKCITNSNIPLEFNGHVTLLK